MTNKNKVTVKSLEMKGAIFRRDDGEVLFMSDMYPYERQGYSRCNRVKKKADETVREAMKYDDGSPGTAANSNLYDILDEHVYVPNEELVEIVGYNAPG